MISCCVEMCLALFPDESSPIQPKHNDEFEFWPPRDYDVMKNDVDPDPDFTKHDGRFQIFDADGRLIADEGDLIEAVGKHIPEAGSFCMFGERFEAREIRLIQARP